MRIWSSLAITIFLCLFSFSANAITQAKEKDIRALLSVMGNAHIAEEVANSLASMVISEEKRKHPDMPKKIEYAVSQAVHEAAMQRKHALNQMLIPIYDKYYTHQEIKSLIAFFKTPIGKKYASVSYAMMQDIIPVTRKWGKKLGIVAAKKVSKKLKEHGYR